MKKKFVIQLVFMFLISLLWSQEIVVVKKEFVRYELQYTDVKDFIASLPQEFKSLGISPISGKNAFVAEADVATHKRLSAYVSLLDTEEGITAVRLKYIQSDELLKYLPPGVSKENIILTPDPNVIFFRGSKEKKNRFLGSLEILDKPKSQIKYRLLVVQYQRSDNLNWAKSLSVAQSKDAPLQKFSGSMSNVFNINFDIVSKLGYQFALKLNFELGENKARVLADTTLNGLSGEGVRFQNTNTFRYVDTAVDPGTGKPLYAGTLREITSGLMLDIKGSLSGDEMISMQINAQVSKQGSGGRAGGTLPPTSEKIISTKIRTRSGTPIIIGGLLQLESSSIQKKIPGLGDIPLLGYAFSDVNNSEEITEMVMYIVPYVHRSDEKVLSTAERMSRYYSKFLEK